MLATQERTALHSHLTGQLENARCLSDALFDIVRADSLYERPIPERHRIVFYIGHLEAFDWNLLYERVLGLKSFQSAFDHLFAFGIDPVGGGLPNDQPSDWPSLDQVKKYVSDVRAALDENLENRLVESSSRTYDGFPLSTLLNVAIEHRLMHVETLSYMLHQLPLDRKIRQAEMQDRVVSPVAPRMLKVPAGSVTLGLSRSSGQFGWDNEFEQQTVEVSAFEIDEFKVTNRQFAEFIAAGGYDTPAFWSGEDWEWKTARQIAHPVFWKRADNSVPDALWLYRTMFNEIPLPMEWPVYVSMAEAKAYARWAGKSLPTEAEWQQAAVGASTDESKESATSSVVFREAELDPNRWNPSPVNTSTTDESTFGVRDMFGNGWEWTSTPFSAFSGFEPFPFYRGYSADFFDGKHFVMKGGSPRTATCMLRPTFRNWFQAHYQYAYAGFRCVTR
jgi:gamma-glutamyl hercynylcysteine S-oxide synthase